METNQKQAMTVVEGTGGRFRWIAITALFLAIGTILRIVSPSIGGVSLNWTISMYCLAIILTRPSIGKAIGIGLVAGALALATSKSLFPYGNLLSEAIGAVVCTALVRSGVDIKIGKVSLQPAICGLVTTVASGLTFVTTAKVVLALPMAVYLYAMLPVVFSMAAINTAITQILYFPAHKIFAKGEE